MRDFSKARRRRRRLRRDWSTGAFYRTAADWRGPRTRKSHTPNRRRRARSRGVFGRKRGGARNVMAGIIVKNISRGRVRNEARH